MAWTWTTPRTFVTAEIETAAIFNSHLRDNMAMAGGNQKPAASVSRAAAQSIPNNVLTAISFDTEVYDTNNGFVATSTNVTAGTAGLWLITAAGGFAAGTSGRRLLQILVNGTAVTESEGAPTATQLTLQGAWQGRLAGADVVTLDMLQVSGGALNTLTAVHERPQLQMTWLGA